MKYKTINNFLATDFFEKLKDLIMNQDFPWRRRDHMSSDVSDKMYFTYGFYNNMNSRSEFYEPYIIPILKKLQAEPRLMYKPLAPIEVRANMIISALFKTAQWHRDYELSGPQCKTSLLYLNDCDGGTELKINNKAIFIKAEANKILVFDTDVLHRATTSKKEPIRYVINFNYFAK